MKRKALIGIFLLLAVGCAIVWHGGRILAAHMAPTLNRSHNSGTDNAGAQRNTTASVMVAGNTRAACPEFVTAGDLIPPESNVSLEDLNGDGRVDAYLFRSSGLTVWINDGTGRFSAATNYPAPATFLSFFDPGDLNGDGKRDFLFRYTIGNTTYMAAYRNKGDGTYEIAQTITLLQIGAAIAGGTTSYSASYPGDFNGDSKIDFLTAVRVNRIDGTSTIGRILIFRNNGDGTFTTDPALDFLDTSASNEFSLVEDFNLDGVMDFALQQSRFGFISGILIYRRVSGATNLSFSETQRISVTQSSTNPRIVWGYLDGFNPPNPPVSSDNYIDLQIQGTSISSWYGSASGMFSQTPPTGNQARDTAPQVNLNNDGIRDSYQIRGVTAADSDLIIQYGNSNGSLRSVATVRIKGSPSVDIADFNGDGKNDFGLRLLGAGNNLSYSLVISGSGETYSTTSLEVNLGTGVSSIKAVSLNGDNKMDLAVTKGSAISMLINNSDCVIAPANTATGSNVTVSSNSTSVTFSNVTTAGTTTITPITPTTAGTLPNGFVIPGGSVAYEIATSAIFSGPLTLTFNVPGVTDAATFTTLRVLHGEGTPQTLVDRTVLSPETPAPNFATKQISARVTTLSPFVIAAQQPLACVTAPSGLVAWYRCEANANDVTGANNGVLQNGLTFVAGKVGQAFSFDGVDDSIQIPASNSLNVGAGAGLTIAMWVNPADLQPLRMLAEWNTGSAFGMHFLHSYNFPEAGAVPGALFVNFGNGAIFQTGAGVVTPNEWQHLAITYNKTSGVARFYRNGQIVKEQNFGSLTPGTTANLYLGVRPNNTLLRYKGLMDETDIFSRALTLSEIQTIFNAGSAGKCVTAPPTNTPPTITGFAVTIPQGSSGSGAQLASVADAETPAGSLTVTATNVPTGITVTNINNDNGTIRANVAATCNATLGTNLVEFTVSDGSAAAKANLTVNVAANTPPALGAYPAATVLANGNVTITPATPPSDNGTIASVIVAASGIVPFLGTATVNATSGVVTVTNARPAGSHPLLVTVTDNCGTRITQTINLTVTCPTITVNPVILPEGSLGASYNQTVTASGGAAPYSFTITEGTLPNGLTLNSNGQITGTATASGSFPFTISARDANGCTATRGYRIGILGACPNITISPSTLPAGSPAGTQLIVTGGTAPYTFSLSGTLPSGITFNNGLFSGTTTATGNFRIVVGVVDANSCRGEQAYFIRLGNPPVIVGFIPLSAVAGSGAFTLTVNGGGFAPNAVVQWNGSNRVTQYVSAAQLRAEITAADIANAGDVVITVVNPGPDGGTSNALIYTIYPASTRFEGDVWPRGSGDGKVDSRDVTMMTRFVLRLATPTTGGEFQRADTAPKASKGDRRITTADVVQVARYTAGLDPLVEAGGPTTPALQDEPTAAAENLAVLQTGSLTATAGNFTRGQIGTVAIQANALGTESAVSFTLNYDIAKLSFLDAMPLNLNGAQVFVNDSIPGQVAVLVLLSAGQTLPAGVTTILNLRFLPNGGAGQTTAAFTFGDEIIAREATDAAASMQQVLTTTNVNNTVNGNAPAFASAASYLGGAVAPADSIVAIFGVNLATATAIGRTIPLPTELAGTTVTLTDSTNKQFAVPLFFVSSGQINCLIPAGAASGAATVTIRNSNGATTTGLLRITDVNPGLFAAAGNGRGLAAAQALRVFADGTLRYENVARFDTTSNQFVPVPIDVSNANEQVFLVLYGTGLRARSDLAEVSAILGGSINGEVLYAGAQGSLAGLDQVNVRLPRGLAGRGDIDVAITVDGKATNTIRLFIR